MSIYCLSLAPFVWKACQNSLFNAANMHEIRVIFLYAFKSIPWLDIKYYHNTNNTFIANIICENEEHARLEKIVSSTIILKWF